MTTEKEEKAEITAKTTQEEEVKQPTPEETEGASKEYREEVTSKGGSEGGEPPTLSPRIEGLSLAALKARLGKANEYLSKHTDELDYRNFDAYLDRASLNFAGGGPFVSIIDDLFMGARCLHQQSKLHLSRHPPNKFLTRRVHPVELGAISGQPSLTIHMGSHFAIPFTLLMANDATYELHKEANLLTAFFSRGSCKTHLHLAGLGALVYSGALGAICRGFDDEAMLAFTVFHKSREPFLEKVPPAAIRPMLLRYDGLNLALLCLVQGSYQALGNILGEIASNFEKALRAKNKGDAFNNPTKSIRYLDISIVSILALAALRQIPLLLPKEGPIAAYQGFVDVFTAAPTRDEEEAKMSAADRLYLKQMGMDPDQIEANFRAQAEANAIEMAGVDASVETMKQEHDLAEEKSGETEGAESATGEAELATSAPAPAEVPGEAPLASGEE